jgi:fused signal recognition particle receptor
MALWERIVRGLGLGAGGSGRQDAERLLLEADFGVKATDEILERVSRAKDGDLRAALERTVAELLASPQPLTPSPLARAATPPAVIVLLGVNGTGKTTTVAKLAHTLHREGRSVLLAAADTFRAGATSQLRIWADRLSVPCVTGPEQGGDPAAVAFDAITAARSRGIDTVLIDTAGRLHTEDRLLDELKKVVRVAAKAHPAGDPPHECLLVLDGTTGQTAVAQGKAFAAAVPLTGLIVTKLDGSARGGSVVALRRELAVPIRFIGTGEGVEDLEVFEAEAYARRLLSA